MYCRSGFRALFGPAAGNDYPLGYTSHPLVDGVDRREEFHVTLVRLEAQPQSVSVARRFVASTLADGWQESLVDDVVLLTSELVTNAVLHGGPYGDDGEVVLWLDSTGSTVRVEVRDENLVVPTVGDATELVLSGRGMYLLDCLASAWGVSADRSGKWVWFEVRV